MPSDLILLIGQSNMAGRGPIDEVQPIADPKISMFRQDQWQAAVEPLHTDKATAGIGLAMSFAAEYRKARPAAEVGLLPCAVGGTPLSRWLPGCDLYQNAVATARSASGAGTLKAILWHQGEADAQDPELATSYGRRLQQMVAALRQELGDLPFVAGGLGDFLATHERCVHYQVVNQALAGLALPGCTFVSAAGLADMGDGIHFGAQALREFGRRYAAAYLAADAQ